MDEPQKHCKEHKQKDRDSTIKDKMTRATRETRDKRKYNRGITEREGGNRKSSKRWMKQGSTDYGGAIEEDIFGSHTGAGGLVGSGHLCS